MNKAAEGNDYWQRVDEFIDLANRLGKDGQSPSKVSSSLLFAAARHNAFLVALTARDRGQLAELKDEAVKHNVERYQQMLTENLDEYAENFEEYIGKNRQGPTGGS